MSEAIECIRRRYRPERIVTLFVGESAPQSGKFFYAGTTHMLTHMQRAVEMALGKNGYFLRRFESYGWYLDDLVLEPVDTLPKSKREALCIGAMKSLADRIAGYSPRAIVTVLQRIAPTVEAAAVMAGHSGPRFTVPFPGMGQQTRFHNEMQRILPLLPRLT
jgi:hypothetical protein